MYEIRCIKKNRCKETLTNLDIISRSLITLRIVMALRLGLVPFDPTRLDYRRHDVSASFRIIGIDPGVARDRRSNAGTRMHPPMAFDGVR